MMKIYFFLILQIFALINLEEAGIYSQSYRQSIHPQNPIGYGTSKLQYNGPHTKVLQNLKSKAVIIPLHRKLNLSAWGIIGIILGVIILSVVTYYTFILYPFLCKKERNYDSIELTEVSACTMSEHTQTVSIYSDKSDTIIN